jgi:hypothetical protein
MDETDLVTISEREVVQRAKIWAEAQANPYATANLVRLKAEELLAAITLLESREQIRKQLTVCCPTCGSDERDIRHLGCDGDFGLLHDSCGIEICPDNWHTEAKNEGK